MEININGAGVTAHEHVERFWTAHSHAEGHEHIHPPGSGLALRMGLTAEIEWPDDVSPIDVLWALGGIYHQMHNMELAGSGPLEGMSTTQIPEYFLALYGSFSAGEYLNRAMIEIIEVWCQRHSIQPIGLSPVESSNIAGAGWREWVDEEDNKLGMGTLMVAFKNDTLYAYFGVPYEVFEGMMDAVSKGSFLNRNVKGTYEYQQVVG